MSASNPFLQRALRFCEVCGLFVGNLTVRQWEQTSHLCQECEESYGNPGRILMTNGVDLWKSHPTVK